MPVWSQTLGLQSLHRSFRKITILKASAGQRDFFLAVSERDADYHFCQRVVKLRSRESS